MDRIFSRILFLAWAAWLGGLLGVFLSVTTVFATLDPDRTTAGTLGAAIFGRAERFILLLAAASIIAALACLLRHRTASRVATLAALTIAAILALSNTLLITPKINALRQSNQTQTDNFKRLHGMSMGVYSSQALTLALTGLLLPATTHRRPDPQP